MQSLICSIVLLGITSCGEKKEYQFDIIKFGRINKKIVEFEFRKGVSNKFQTLFVDLIKTQKIIVDENYYFTGLTTEDDYELFFYPSLYSLKGGGAFEVYIYKRPVVKREGGVYKITPCESVHKYFLYTIVNDKIVLIFSEDPNIDTSKLDSEHLELTYMDNIPQVLLSEVKNKGIIGGYLVKSKLDNTLIQLR
jgi:hypothetical protein